MPNASSSYLAVVPAYNEAFNLPVAQRQAIPEQRLSEAEHARAVATDDKVRTLEPLLRGDD